MRLPDVAGAAVPNSVRFRTDAFKPQSPTDQILGRI